MSSPAPWDQLKTDKAGQLDAPLLLLPPSPCLAAYHSHSCVFCVEEQKCFYAWICICGSSLFSVSVGVSNLFLIPCALCSISQRKLIRWTQSIRESPPYSKQPRGRHFLYYTHLRNVVKYGTQLNVVHKEDCVNIFFKIVTLCCNIVIPCICFRFNKCHHIQRKTD